MSESPFLLSQNPQRWRYNGDLLYELVLRDLKLRYKRSIAGLAWSLLNPLAQLLVFYFVFTRILPLNRPNFATFLFCGLLPWTWFQSSLLGGAGTISDSRELIRRPGFPIAILPVVRVASDLLHFLLALPVLLFLLAFNSIYPGPTLLLLPIIVTIQFLLTLSLVYFVATIQVRFRDTQYLLGIALLLFFYLTPIFYDATNVPARYAGIFRLNPMLHFVESYRAIFLHNRVPNLSPLLIVGLISVGLTWLGYKIYMRASWHFAEEL